LVFGGIIDVSQTINFSIFVGAVMCESSLSKMFLAEQIGGDSPKGLGQADLNDARNVLHKDLASNKFPVWVCV
jgi:hypothetical protein